jgi:hypothetical protein
VVMFGCPNDGSDFLIAVRRFTLRRHAQERSLRPLDRSIADTRRVVIERAVFATEVTATTCPIHITACYGIEDAVVRPGSAKGIFTSTRALPGDHSSIVRPAKRDDDSYLTLAQELGAAAEHISVLQPEPDAALPLSFTEGTVSSTAS